VTAFYLGTHRPHWLNDATVALFVSRRVLAGRRSMPIAAASWALDSGGFTELNLYGEWRTTEDEYVRDVRRFADEIGRLAWVAPMDYMCEPVVLLRTGLTVKEHQRRTVANYLRLRERLGALVIPVLQGYTETDYLACWKMYDLAGVTLEDAPLVGLGSICRRQNMAEAGTVARSLHPLRLHGFGVKITGLQSFGDCLASADSLAWSYSARRDDPLIGCTHRTCTNCRRYALRWRNQVIDVLSQQRLEMPA
jgi:hypothetical protein